MRAAVLTETNKPLEILDLDQEGPKTGEAKVRVKAAGICMSDWHVMNGDWPVPLPVVPGHEAAGIVEEVGPGVVNLAPGDHVIFSFRPHCGRCRYCVMGRSVLCIGRMNTPGGVQYDGTSRISYKGKPINQMTRIGTFAEAVICSTEQLVKIRKDMPFAQAALIGCSVSTGFGAVARHAKVQAGASVLVIGTGGVGLNIVQSARLAGARTIIAADIVERKLEFARDFGATHCINARDADVVAQAKAITGGLGVDFAFDAIGADVTVSQIVNAIAPGGQAVMVGIPAATTLASISPFQMVFQEKALTGSFFGSVRPDLDFPILADLYMDGKFDIDRLISRTYRFEQINEGFDLLRQGAVARGVIVFD